MSTENSEMLHDHESRITKLENCNEGRDANVKELQRQMIECEKLHNDMKEHSRRSEDAINNNTRATLLLVESNKATTESNIELAQAFKAFKEHVEKEHDPVIAWYAPYIKTGEDIKGFFRVNTVLVKWIIGAVITGAAFYTALKTFA